LLDEPQRNLGQQADEPVLVEGAALNGEDVQTTVENNCDQTDCDHLAPTLV